LRSDGVAGDLTRETDTHRPDGPCQRQIATLAAQSKINAAVTIAVRGPGAASGFM